ncbi:MAG: NADH-quinone oxidoreductase subunit L [Myxococcales bacterium]|nr:NADH-quinone oxidoreductase subunit L [Myxococcales bacterium]MCB9628342.1 NADH-quinone oxidoreductase subunit L [Sandaracinaceae bacterium]
MSGDLISHESALLLIVVLPILGALINGLWLRAEDKKYVSVIAPGLVGLAFLLAVFNFIHLLGLKAAGSEDPRITLHLYEWFSLQLPGGAELPVNVTFAMDSLSGLMTLVVTGIGTLIHIYSLGYMSEEKSYNRFFAYLNLFTASMLILVLASNLPLMFVGWEGVGLCSYLLIGFWFENKTYAAAGRKAFVANRVGDLGVIMGMFCLVLAAGSFEFESINALASNSAGSFVRSFPIEGLQVSLATVACLFLFLGVTGKSAQVPLYIWLPDAMAGPTPVSALIHAATMVTAGVYLMCRLSPVFLHSPFAMGVIAVVGTVTALLAASIAVVQHEMKKILAYSTVSQLGFMVAACGVGAFSAGFFHVFTHAFFKACLFLGAGSVMHAVHAHGDADIFKLGGMKKYVKITHWTFLLSCLAIAGFPGFSGFFSKDEILYGAAAQALGEHGSVVGWFVLVGLSLAAFMTAFYMFRLYFLTFTGTYRSGAHGDDEHGHDSHGHGHDDHGYDPHPHDGGWEINLPLAVLGAGAVCVGWLGLPHAFHLPNWWGGWMEASIAYLPGHGPHDEIENMMPVYLAMGLGTIAALGGIGLAYVLYNDKEEDTFTTKIPKGLFNLMFDKWRVDELYGATILRPIRALARIVGNVDQTFVDGILAGLTARVVSVSGWLATRVQTGSVHAYGFGMTLGVLGLLWWAVNPHAELTVEVVGEQVVLHAAPGMGYTYAFDGNGNNHSQRQFVSHGEGDRDWGSSPDFEPHYFAEDCNRFLLSVETEHPRLPERVDVGEGWQVLDFPGLDWRTDSVAPAEDERLGFLWSLAGREQDVLIRRTQDGIDLRPNGADVAVDGQVVLAQADGDADGEHDAHAASGGVIHLTVGQTVTIGHVDFVVRGVIDATVHVRSAFGGEDTATVEIVLESAPPPSQGEPTHAALTIREPAR